MQIPRTFQTSHQTASLLDPADQSLLRILEHDWRRMCGLDMVPTHTTLNPVDLDAALPHAFIVHRTAPNATRIRVAGQRLHDLIRMDPRGMPFSTFFSDGSRDLAMSVLDHAFTTPAILGLALTAPRGLGRKPLRAEALLLPLRDAEGELTRMMGAIVTSGPLPTKPARFDIAKGQPLRCDPLYPGLMDRRARRSHAPVAATDSDMIAGPPGLRLVVDNT